MKPVIFTLKLLQNRNWSHFLQKNLRVLKNGTKSNTKIIAVIRMEMMAHVTPQTVIRTAGIMVETVVVKR